MLSLLYLLGSTDRMSRTEPNQIVQKAAQMNRSRCLDLDTGLTGATQDDRGTQHKQRDGVPERL